MVLVYDTLGMRDTHLRLQAVVKTQHLRDKAMFDRSQASQPRVCLGASSYLTQRAAAGVAGRRQSRIADRLS